MKSSITKYPSAFTNETSFSNEVVVHYVLRKTWLDFFNKICRKTQKVHFRAAPALVIFAVIFAYTADHKWRGETKDEPQCYFLAISARDFTNRCTSLSRYPSKLGRISNKAMVVDSDLGRTKQSCDSTIFSKISRKSFWKQSTKICIMISNSGEQHSLNIYLKNADDLISTNKTSEC